MRHFCIAGPVKTDIHYVLPPLGRINLEEVMEWIDAQKYFILHAPRQTGKTSTLDALVHHLNDSGRYKALYINVEAGQAARDDVQEGIRAILPVLGKRALKDLGDSFLEERRAAALEKDGPGAFQSLLSDWSAQNALPICLMIDEIDALVGDTLISLLRQLRTGYKERPKEFPQSIVLCGVRDVRDYRIHGTKEIITGGSAFNVKAESLRMADFSEERGC